MEIAIVVAAIIVLLLLISLCSIKKHVSFLALAIRCSRFCFRSF